MVTEPGVSSTSIPNLVRSRISLYMFKRSKTSWGMERAKPTNHGCIMLIFGLRRRIITVVERTMLLWSIEHISPILYKLVCSRSPPKFPFTTDSTSLFSSWNVLPKSFRVCAFPILRFNFDFSRFSATFMEIYFTFGTFTLIHHLEFRKTKPQVALGQNESWLSTLFKGVLTHVSATLSFSGYKNSLIYSCTLKKAALPKRRLKLFWTASSLQFSN